MGVVIKGTGVSRPDRRPWSHGARRLADSAMQRCLRQSGHSGGDVDMLINAGIYRERGLGEPALAALIQEDVEANPGDPAAVGHGTFSFDIDNGACGVLTGVEILRGFLLSGAIDVGVVVTSDSAPGPTHVRELPYPEAGGALLLSRDDEVEGFSQVRLSTFPEYASMAEGFWEWRERRVPVGASAGGNRLVVQQRPGFLDRATDCAVEATSEFLDAMGVAPGDVDLLVATPQPGFADPLADRLGIPHERTLHVGEHVGRMHTAQPVAAIDLAVSRTGRWAAARTILLVSAGSGITVANALYRH